MPHTYVFPLGRLTSDHIPIKNYWQDTYIGTKSISAIISQAKEQISDANCVMIFQNANAPYDSYAWIYACHVTADEIRCIDYTASNTGGAGSFVSFAGINQLPQNGHCYGFYGSGGLSSKSPDNPPYQHITFNNRDYQGYGWTNAAPSIIVLIDSNATVYLNDEDETPIVYIWEPVSHLAGNDNQFYLALSQIDASIIGDGITNATSDDSSKFIINEISNISRLLANIPNNIETVLAYSGNNYMTVIRRWSEGIAPYNNIFFTFKLYSSDDQLLYTTPEIGVSDPPVPRKYLSFITDDEHEAAMFDLIRYNQNTDVYSYNNMPLPVPTAEEMNNIWTWLQGSNPEPESNDPYATGSTDDGGDPGNPRPQDHISDTPAPTLSGTNLGIVTLYQPDDTELLKISDFLWSDDVLDNFKKYFNNFADNILALYILPYTPANLPAKIFKVGKLASEDAALQAVSYCTQRYYDIDMGSVDIGQRWGSYLDYAPYTKIEVYLPYCGIHSLDIDELMSPAKMNGTLPIEQGCTLSLKYRMDILTGVIVAKLLVNGDVRYQFNGKTGSNIPLTGQTYSNWLGSIITAGSAAAITIATGGMTAPLVAGSAASVAGTVLAQKPNVESIGNISGDASMLATNVPYVRISSPNKPLLENQEVFTGYPSYKSGTVGSFSGYTEFVDAHVEGISCTEEERAEIISLLKEGVII